jgi:hypothetical protein
MRRVTLSRFGSPTPPDRWHDRYEEPRWDQEIEVDIGDGGVWSGVRYARDVESFVDVDSGAPISIAMWRYTRWRGYVQDTATR